MSDFLPLEKLILASSSPRRKALLEKVGIAFEVCVPDVHEADGPGWEPEALVRHNAALKAHAIAEKLLGGAILAADTTVALDGRIFNKPKDLNEAYRTLEQLSGKVHTVLTGLHWIEKQDGQWVNEVSWVTLATVRFKKLTTEAILRYIQLVNTLDKAGAYSIEEHQEIIIEGYKGFRSTILGLPVESQEFQETVISRFR